ncbi:MAG: hypothetical protein IKP64_03550, partial [Selenomonadaceae bacterium]|nr:hypothetical protein [Selenomonadaceae bacterium]
MDEPGFDLQRFASYGTEGNDLLYVDSSYSYVFAYGGNDTIRNVYDGVQIYAGTGNDSVYNGGYYAFIDAGTGNDTIYNAVVNNVTVLGGTGDDSISNYSAWYSTIDAGTGNDTIVVPYRAWSDSINGGTGNDRISLGTSSNEYNGNNTIVGGTGNDTIYGNPNATVGNVYQYFYGDGYDVITNWNAKDTLSFGSGVYYTRSTVGSNLLLGIVNSVGNIGAITLSGASGKTINISGGTPTIISNNVYGTSGNDTLRVKANNSSVFAYGGNDSIYNDGYDSVTIDAGDGNDTIYNDYVDYVSVFGGAGNDSINNYSAWYSTVDAGAGDDTIVVSYRAWQDSINGGAGNDKVSLGTAKDANNGYNTIVGGTGDDTIYGNPNATVGNVYQYFYGDGYDSITNWNAKDTVRFGSGIYYTRSTVGSNVLLGIVNSSGSIGAITLSGASGKTINISGGIQTIVSSVISNYNKNSLVSGSSANDTIYNYAGGATIRGNGGNDYIDNSTSSYYTVNGGYGYVTVDGGDGNDTIKSYDPYVSLSGGAGADVISLRPSTFTNVTVNGGTGNDTIYGNSVGGGVLYQYKKGDGNDLIYYFNANDTLSISGGSYTTTTSSNNILVNLAGGETITLQGAKGMSPIIYPTISPVIINYNNDTIVNGTSSNDTIYNSGSRVKIYASTGNDSIYNGGDYHDNVTIDAGAGNDTIFNNYVNNVSVSGGTGDDSISNYSAWYSTIDAGAGDDTIIVPFRAWHDSINGGADNDRISLGTTKNEYNGYNTIVGGKGDDTIYGNPNATVGNVYQYAKGDGNDIIYSYNAKDSITITGGSSWSTAVSGSNDVVVKVADSGNITLVGAKGKTLNIYPEKSPDPDPTPPSTDVTAQDVIKKFMGVLDTTTYSGRAALNEAVKVATGGYFSNLDAAIDQMILDCKNTNNATRFLSEYCDIDLTNTDTGAITGSDAGGATTKTASSIVPESGRLDSSFTGSSFTTKGLTVQLSSFDFYGNNYNTTYDKLSGANQKYIWQALKTWWVDGAINLITSSYGNNYGFGSGATGNKLNFGFYNEDSGVMAVTTGWYTDSSHKTIGKLDMKVNMKNYANLIVGDEDGKISGKNGFQLDRVLAHEFTHALMYVNINYAGDLPNFIMEGMAELTHGTDDDRKSELTNLAKNPSALTNALNFDCYDSYAGGYMFLRYLAKQGSEHYSALSSSSAVVAQSKSADASSSGSSSGVSVKNSVLTLAKDFSDSILDLTNYNSVKTVNATAMGTGIMIIGNKNPLSISAGAGADSIFANVGNDTINGGAGNDILYGEAGNDAVRGDAGNDSLNGGTGNDTLTGGDGKNVFIFGKNSGNDVITDYTSGQDKIKLLDGEITSSSISGSDVVLQMGLSDTIKIKGGKDQKITVIDGDGKETTKVYNNSGGGGSTISGGKTLKVTKTKVTLDSSYANADASAMKSAVNITGNAAANSILGGKGKDTLYGGDGNDTLLGKAGNDKIYGQNGDDFLWGESGNDTLFGGTGNDVFIYSAGKDVIADFTVGDKISLGAAISKSSVKGSDVILTIGSGTLTVKDGKGKSLSLIDKTGKESSTIFGGSDTVVGGTTLKVTKTKVTLDSSYANADASAMTSAVNITGNDAANSILGGKGKDTLYGGAGNDYLSGNAGNDKIYGQAGNDTLWGGAGNDTLFGGDGSDVFIYSAGKDVISGFDTGDLLQITGTFTGTYNKSSKSISIKVGSTANAITIKDFTATTFNINGDSYGISGTKLV